MGERFAFTCKRGALCDTLIDCLPYTGFGCVERITSPKRQTGYPSLSHIDVHSCRGVRMSRAPLSSRAARNDTSRRAAKRAEAPIATAAHIGGSLDDEMIEYMQRYVVDNKARQRAMEGVEAAQGDLRYRQPRSMLSGKENYGTLEPILRCGTADSAATARFMATLRDDGPRPTSSSSGPAATHRQRLMSPRNGDRPQWRVPTSVRNGGGKEEDILISLLRQALLDRRIRNDAAQAKPAPKRSSSPKPQWVARGGSTGSDGAAQDARRQQRRTSPPL
jgi:hypothetical protein